VNLISVASLDAPVAIQAKIRHSQAPVGAVLHPPEVGSDGTLGAEVRFMSPQRAITPGQSVVFYQEDMVVGGGVIGRHDR